MMRLDENAFAVSESRDDEVRWARQGHQQYRYYCHSMIVRKPCDKAPWKRRRYASRRERLGSDGRACRNPLLDMLPFPERQQSHINSSMTNRLTNMATISSSNDYLHNARARKEMLEATLADLESHRNRLAVRLLNSADSQTTTIDSATTNSHNSSSISQNTTPNTCNSSEESAKLQQEDLARALSLARASHKARIQLLTQYNDIKDIGQGLMGLIAEQRGCRVVDVMRDLGVEDD